MVHPRPRGVPVSGERHDVAGEPRWLDAEEREAWMAVTALIARLPAALDRQLRCDSQLTHFEYVVMAVLSETAERTLRMSTVAELIGAQLPRLSQVVTRLENRAWLVRRPDPTDGRYTLVTLTDAGFDKVVASAPGHVETVRRLVFDGLTQAQVRQLREVGRRITNAISLERNL